ncbi:MAG: glutamate--tRNA ligase [Candidatus Babeliales bacterium]
MNTVRVRFAPSPTGHLHIGGLRTALFNVLFARHNKGTFIIRVEDTDRERSHKDFVASQLASLEWAGIRSDEPLVFQTERMFEYEKYIKKLLDEKKAYRCFCAASEGDEFYKYDGACRSRQVTDEDLKKPHVIRIKFPLERATISFHDLVRGTITFPSDQFDDFIIARSDGMPIYNFVVVIDDALMHITHVIRGEDHISNTPKQCILYEALGFTAPQFAHIPLILGSSGQRLSKRDAATSVLEYKKAGYLSDAFCNYLVRLGWSHGDQEIFTREQMIELFSLDHVGKSGAIFDQAKLDWINSHYIKETNNEKLLHCTVQDVQHNLFDLLGLWSEEQIRAFIGLYKERVKTLRQLVDDLQAVHDKSTQPTEQELAQWATPEALHTLKEIMALLDSCQDFSLSSVTDFVKSYVKQKGLKFVTCAQPIRLALIGSTNGPGVFELLEVLGKTESISRIKQFLVTYNDQKNTR